MKPTKAQVLKRMAAGDTVWLDRRGSYILRGACGDMKCSRAISALIHARKIDLSRDLAHGMFNLTPAGRKAVPHDPKTEGVSR